ncbi:MAG: glycosyltransferase family 4 protein [Anaerolineales bacterium]|nr:glycosyltransferase family 4 protein [Anaerolineales bacterium]
MKFAFLLTQSLDSPSGLGRFGPLAREFIRHGHEVDLLALHYDYSNLKLKSYIDQGVHVNYVGQMHVRKQGPRKTYFGTRQLLSVSMNSTLQLARALRKSDADIVQICKPQPMNVLAAHLGARARPVFCDCDDYEAETNLFTNKWQKRIVQYFEDGIVNYVSGITVNTRFSFKRYEALGFQKQHLVYVPNGAERNRFSVQTHPDKVRNQWGLNPDHLIVLYTGTLGIHSHPVDLLIDAFALVCRDLPNARLIIVGSGEDYDLLKDRSRQLDITDYVIFTGRISPEEIPDYISAAAVSVDPVKDDLTAKARSPLKIMESLVVGTPVVTSDVGDRRSILNDGEYGILVPPGNVQGLSNGIIQILVQPAKRAKMAEAATNCREQWLWNNLSEKFLSIYDLAGIDI